MGSLHHKSSTRPYKSISSNCFSFSEFASNRLAMYRWDKSLAEIVCLFIFKLNNLNTFLLWRAYFARVNDDLSCKHAHHARATCFHRTESYHTELFSASLIVARSLTAHGK